MKNLVGELDLLLLTLIECGRLTLRGRLATLTLQYST